MTSERFAASRAGGPEGLGPKIRLERTRQGLTLKDVAGRAGVSVSFLSQIERDEAKPSVGTLHDVAEALGLTLAEFFDPGTRRAPPVTTATSAIVTRADERKTLIYPGSGIMNELVTPDLKRNLQMMWVVMPPGSDTGDQPLAHEGEECGIVVQGKVEIWVGDEEHYVLGPGDAIWQLSTVPHRSRNAGDTDAIIVVAITPPSL